MVQARKEVSGAGAGTEAKLVLGQKILLFQVGHDPPVHHFLHDFGEDAQQGHRAIILDGCSGPFLMDWDDVDLFLWIGTTWTFSYGLGRRGPFLMDWDACNRRVIGRSSKIERRGQKQGCASPWKANGR